MDTNKIWEEIIAQTKEEKGGKRPGEMSAKDFASECGISVSIARRRLNDLVEKGTLTKRQILSNRAWEFVYSPAISNDHPTRK